MASREVKWRIPDEGGQRMVDIVTDDQFIPDPSVLKIYERIHVPFAPVVSDAAMEGLRSGGVPLVADETWGRYDEYGGER
jgi:hypothetical protein